MKIRLKPPKLQATEPIWIVEQLLSVDPNAVSQTQTERNSAERSLSRLRNGIDGPKLPNYALVTTPGLTKNSNTLIAVDLTTHDATKLWLPSLRPTSL